MKWNLSGVSSAEIIGTTAVVLSLIFVGVQIRDGNREARATTIQSTLNSEMELIAILTENASTWDKVITGAPLASGEEMRKGILLYNLLMTERENRYYQFKSGYLETETWEGSLSALRLIADLPMFEIWRATPGAMNHSTEFLELLDGPSGRVSGE